MHLRTKLTLGILLATLATFAAVGAVAIPAAKEALRDRIDDRLRADLPAARAALGGRAGGGEYAVLVIERSRTRVLARSGAPGAPDDPPALTAADELATGGRVEYADARDGTKYRYTSVALGDGRTLALAAPVDDLRALVNELIGTFSMIGVIGGGVLALLSWWWIRHSTRPIERLTARADAIARGDPDRRLAVPAGTAELRRLADALDAMVGSVDASLQARTRSEARLREFVADASHELRTPLTSVSGYLQLDLDGALADEARHRDAMGRALAEASRMRRIVDDLMLLAELDSERGPSLVELDASELVRGALHDAALDPERVWRFEAADGPLPVRADADQLRQVVANLLDNVRVHAPPGTVATASTARRGDRVVLEVADDGPGLPEAELAQAFDRFWRHDRSRSRRSGGSGLGLSIVASLVEAHGGTVEALATPGGGLTVRVALPASG